MATYWQQLQLSFDPFMTEQINDTPYLSPRFEQQLDLLAHLASSENKIQLVTGLTGIGKTTMMRLLLKELVDSVAVCKVHGGATITPDVLQELLARHLNISVDASQTELYKQAFKAKIILMQQKNQNFYLLIDNAHKLPKASLAFLLNIMSWQPDNSNVVHIILFGGPQLEAIFAELTSTVLGEQHTHTIRLEPLSEEEVKHYIKHRLSLAGWNKVFPFQDVEISKITQISNGIPAKINYLAKQVLQKKIQASPVQRSKGKNHMAKIKMAGISVAVLLIGLIVFNTYENYDKSQATNSNERKLAIHAEPMNIQKVKATQSIPQQINAHEQSAEGIAPPQVAQAQPVVAQTQPVIAKAPQPTVTPTQPIMAKTQLQAPVVQEQPTIAPVAAKPSLISASQIQQPTTSIVEINKPKQPAQPAVHYVLNEKYIMSRNKAHYALQLAGAYKLIHLEQYFAAVQMPEQVHYFKTELNGKPWYVAVYGDFATHKAAKQAINNLPAKVQSSQPWPRSYASIQSAIEG